MRTLEDYLKDIKKPELLSPEERQIIAIYYHTYSKLQEIYDKTLKFAIDHLESDVDYGNNVNDALEQADQAKEVLEQAIEDININHNLKYHNDSEEKVGIPM